MKHTWITSVLFCTLGGMSAAQANPDLPISILGQSVQIVYDLSLAFGPSLPDSAKQTSIADSRGPSRSRQGEWIQVDFTSPKQIQDVKLSGFSKSGRGKVLIRNAEAVMADPASSNSEIRFSIGELFDFGRGAQGLYQKYAGNLIMLGNGNYVTTLIQKTLASIAFQVEGFTDDDATLLINMKSPEGFNIYDFKISRVRQDEPVTPDPGGGSHSGGVLRDGYYSSSRPDICGVEMLSRGNNLFLRSCPGRTDEAILRFQCDWNSGVCRLIDAPPGQNCAGMVIYSLDSRTAQWQNPCTGGSGLLNWERPR